MNCKFIAVILLLCIGDSFFEASVSAAKQERPGKSDRERPHDKDQGAKKPTDHSHESQASAEEVESTKKGNKDINKSRNENPRRDEPKHSKEIKENPKQDFSKQESSILRLEDPFLLPGFSYSSLMDKTGDQPPENCGTEPPLTCSCSAEAFKALGDEFISCTIKITEEIKKFNESCQGDPYANLIYILEEFRVNITVEFEILYPIIQENKCDEAYYQFQKIVLTFVEYQEDVTEIYKNLDDKVKEAIATVQATCQIEERMKDCTDKLDECPTQ